LSALIAARASDTLLNLTNAKLLPSGERELRTNLDVSITPYCENKLRRAASLSMLVGKLATYRFECRGAEEELPLPVLSKLICCICSVIPAIQARLLDIRMQRNRLVAKLKLQLDLINYCYFKGDN